MVVVAARRDERRLRAVPLRKVEAEDATVERQCPLQVGDLQVDVADADLGINRVRRIACGHVRSFGDDWSLIARRYRTADLLTASFPSRSITVSQHAPCPLIVIYECDFPA